MPIRERMAHEGVEGVRVGRFNQGINTTFILYRIGATQVDTGPPNQWSTIRRLLDAQPPTRLLLTHHHEDHAGNAARIADRYRLMPFAPETGRTKLARGYRIPPIQRLIWGSPQPVETLPLPERIPMPEGGALQPVHTPGHAKDLTCFYWPERGYLFSGDLYLSKSIRYLRADEDLLQLMQSIKKVLALDFDVLFCPHRGIVPQGQLALQEKLDNLKHLCLQASVLHRDGVGTQEIVNRLLGPEDWLSKLSGYNISKGNLIRQAVEIAPERI
ncbi:MBL fold metallo-hydrolase [Ferrimonas sediminicola]|uniref:MBL fold metallo-hydrolase n=1 Tax=Ferrimonas sediminicola TaxID=2569538 RepID=A0A4V5NXB2_9GAMM|nr:MBL fold metallo-hydrolase [Ferrimonas sediminicola]TKB50353.1 MBL fold metallo-hydrolase [Ferrimonas sediminicola]